MPSGPRVVIDEDDTASVVTLIWIVDTGYVDDLPEQLNTITTDEMRNALAPCASSAVTSTVAPKP